MPFAPKKPQAEFAKIMAAACVRRGYLEKLHCGRAPVTSSLSDLDGSGRKRELKKVKGPLLD
jgi:hypothetical protein